MHGTADATEAYDPAAGPAATVGDEHWPMASAAGRLPDPRLHRRRGHGRGLRGGAGIAQAAAWRSRSCTPVPRQRRLPAAVPQRSPLGGPVAPHQHRLGLRLRRARRRLLLRHAVHRRPRPGQGPGRRPPAPLEPRSGRPRRSGRTRPNPKERPAPPRAVHDAAADRGRDRSPDADRHPRALDRAVRPAHRRGSRPRGNARPRPPSRSRPGTGSSRR